MPYYYALDVAETPEYPVVLTWTNEPPKQEGVYWAYGEPKNERVSDEPEIVYFTPGSKEVTVIGADYGIDASFYTHWLGPLLKPEAPKKEGN